MKLKHFLVWTRGFLALTRNRLVSWRRKRNANERQPAEPKTSERAQIYLERDYGEELLSVVVYKQLDYSYTDFLLGR